MEMFCSALFTTKRRTTMRSYNTATELVYITPQRSKEAVWQQHITKNFLSFLEPNLKFIQMVDFGICDRHRHYFTSALYVWRRKRKRALNLYKTLYSKRYSVSGRVVKINHRLVSLRVLLVIMAVHRIVFGFSYVQRWTSRAHKQFNSHTISQRIKLHTQSARTRASNTKSDATVHYSEINGQNLNRIT